MLRIAVARLPDVPTAVGADAPGWMGDSERRRWPALPPAARREFAASRALLRQLLEDSSGLAATAWDVSAEADSPPVPTATGVPPGGFHASLSHRLGWVAAAIAGSAVGIDIECERPPRSDPGERARLMLSQPELARWHALPDHERDGALLTHWTLKEAWFKAHSPEASAWDFRRVVASACEPAHANARAWTAPPLHVALCCGDPAALAAAACVGLDEARAHSSFWRVERADLAT